MYKDDNMEAKVIAGEVFGIKSPVTTRTPAYYLDIHMKKGKTYEHLIPPRWNSMVVLYSGSLTIQKEDTSKLEKGHVAVFEVSSDMIY